MEIKTTRELVKQGHKINPNLKWIQVKEMKKELVEEIVFLNNLFNYMENTHLQGKITSRINNLQHTLEQLTEDSND